MPNQSHSGIHGVPWARCQRCGMEYRVSEMVRQRGLLLCTEKCFDDPLLFEREEIIKDILEFGGITELEPVDIIKESTDDTREF